MKMPIPDDWDGQSFCRFAVCWPDSPLWKIILRGLVTTPARGFFWDERTGYVKGVLAGFRQTVDENIELPEVIMACGDTGLQEIAAALNKIGLAMQQQVTVNANCCGDGRGSGGQGQTPPPYNPIEEGDPGVDPPPEGFDDWAQFDANKCAVATDILVTLRGDIGRMSSVNFALGVLTTLIPIVAPLLLTPIPGDEIAAAITILLIFAAFGAVILSQVQDVLSEYQQDLICALYNGSSSADAEAKFEQKFNDSWDASPYSTEIWSLSAKEMIAHMIGSASTNKLFELQSDRILPPGDCSNCVECTGLSWDFADFSAQGWELGEDNGTGSTLTPQDGSILVHSNAGMSPGTRIVSPEFSHVIQPGDRINWYMNTSVLFVFGCWITLDGVPQVEISYPNFSNPGQVNASVDLTPWAGQEASQIYLYASIGSGNNPAFDIEYLCVTIGCPDAEPGDCI